MLAHTHLLKPRSGDRLVEEDSADYCMGQMAWSKYWSFACEAGQR
ncbi:MAG: hypothetical protein RBS53_12775 [Bacteroidales bacterium]|nr:hypothetical protein [Bacteroidales bacterium]